MDNSTDQRQYIRYPLGIEATAVAGNKTPIERCLVHTISYSGASMNLLIREGIVPGQNIMLEIPFPEKNAPVIIIVKLKWVDMIQGDGPFNAVAGGVIVFIKDEDRKTMLDYAFKQVLAAEEK